MISAQPLQKIWMMLSLGLQLFIYGGGVVCIKRLIILTQGGAIFKVGYFFTFFFLVK